MDVPSNPRRIVQLDESVINRIAAGEIIIRPANALKELLENSIDAKASMIEIIVKDGGLKLLQITDNGSGIDRDDLGLLCERFATSKLQTFEDLTSIATYGFRGEALASISHIARLSVTTKTKESPLAYKAFYSNGKLADLNFSSAGDSVEPKPIAGKQGTTILVEDLFYNSPARSNSSRSKNDEFIKILDVVGRYAVHSSVGISCKKFGDTFQVLATRPKLSLKERIRTVYGSSVASDLIEFKMEPSEIEELEKEFGLVECQGAITNLNYVNKKKLQPVIFINGRSVACDPLKRSLMSTYLYFLPKGNLPFIYLSLVIRQENVDVNVHPTKREVRFLHEDEIIDAIGAKFHSILTNVDTSRTFRTQSVLMRTKRSGEDSVSISANSDFGHLVLNQALDRPIKKYRQENKLVRTDSMQSKLQTFMKKDNMTNKPDMEESSISEIVLDNEKERVEVKLSSILQLKKDIVNKTNKELTEAFNGCTYVGIIDELRRLCSFQYGVKLFNCDYGSILSEFFYQCALEEFQNFGEYTLLEPLPIEDILNPLIDSSPTGSVDLGYVQEKILSMKEMFKEYFSLVFNDQCQLLSLPMFLLNIEPQIEKLPYFIYRLGYQINYEDEQECLEGVLREIALLYVPVAIPIDNIELLHTTQRNQLDMELENHIFPLLRKRFIATSDVTQDVMEIADLPGLYKVFERC